jgi:hypothetical protein
VSLARASAIDAATLRFRAAALAAALLSLPLLAAQTERHNVVLITLDGARPEEVFGGLDAVVLASTLGNEERLEEHPTYRRFWAPSAEARREKLMPFFWSTLMREQGSIAGNRAIGSAVALRNGHVFSYPGYAEMLLGVAHDDRINSNDPIANPYPTVLEFLRERLQLPREQVAVFASWNVLDAIAESRAGALTINAGYEPYDGPDPDAGRLNRLMIETPTPWDSVRHDAYTFRYAMAHLKTYKPRVLYVALGETDDWAHEGRYDRVLEAYVRSDRYIQELWEWLQAEPEYRGRTNVLITTDHGRGKTATDWRHHGAKHARSNETWMAFIGPASQRRGEWRDHPPIPTAAVAATLVEWMGDDWRAFNPDAASPVE